MYGATISLIWQWPRAHSQQPPVLKTKTQQSALDDTPSQVDASTVEQAATVVQDGRISLDSKLSIFTVLGTTEPHGVKLFPHETCSCPATEACYHIVAARRAVGITGTDWWRIVNLTQLWCNKRKHADKTGGRKQLRAANVNVVAAPDADAGLGAAVLGSLALSPAPPASPAINTDIHHSCNAVEPPPRKNTKQQGPVNWVKCDACPCGHAGTTQFAWGYGTLWPCISLWDVQLLGLKTVRNFAYSTFSTTAKFFSHV